MSCSGRCTAATVVAVHSNTTFERAPINLPCIQWKVQWTRTTNSPFTVVAVSSVLKRRSSCALEFVQTSKTCSPGVFYSHQDHFCFLSHFSLCLPGREVLQPDGRKAGGSWAILAALVYVHCLFFSLFLKLECVNCVFAVFNTLK